MEPLLAVIPPKTKQTIKCYTEWTETSLQQNRFPLSRRCFHNADDSQTAASGRLVVSGLVLLIAVDCYCLIAESTETSLKSNRYPLSRRYLHNTDDNQTAASGRLVVYGLGFLFVVDYFNFGYQSPKITVKQEN
jgi:RNA:NAD 2'-phosphotransferase (TPT1/KptA family)